MVWICGRAAWCEPFLAKAELIFGQQKPVWNFSHQNAGEISTRLSSLSSSFSCLPWGRMTCCKGQWVLLQKSPSPGVFLPAVNPMGAVGHGCVFWLGAWVVFCLLPSHSTHDHRGCWWQGEGRAHAGLAEMCSSGLRTAQKVQNLSGLSLGSIQMAILGQLDLIRSSIMSKPFWPHPGSWQSFLPYLMLSAAWWQICMSLVCHSFLLFHFQCLFSQLNEEEGRLLPTPRQEGYLRLFHWWAAHYQCLLDFLHGGLRVT